AEWKCGAGGDGKHVVEKIVIIIPESDSCVTDIRHCARDMQEMIQELDSHVFVDGVAAAELDRDAQHVEAEHRHPGSAVGLLDASARRQRLRTVEHADIVEAKE